MHKKDKKIMYWALGTEKTRKKSINFQWPLIAMKWIHLCLKATTLAIQDCLDEGCSVEASRGTLRRHP